MATSEYMSAKENYEELLHEARKMTVKNIRIALQQRGSFHQWAIEAFEKALEEKLDKKLGRK